MTPDADAGDARIRIDRWLFHARMFRTRSMAAAGVVKGGIRVNGAPCIKPAQLVGPGDVVTIAAGRQVRALRVLDIGTRRGPAPEAQMLYDLLSDETPGKPGR